MFVDDIKLTKQDASPRLQQLIMEIVQILNEDGYQRRIYATAPQADSTGFEGEKRVVQVGSTLREYVYANGKWWMSTSFTEV